MLEGIWKQLKSGTDVRGVALPGVAGQDVDLTEARVRAIASAFVAFQTERGGKKAGEMTVAVGRDSRLSGPAIAGWVIEELKNAGCRVLDCGMASTPAMFMTTVYRKTDAAVMITASHHPWNRNGLKFFLPTGGLEGKEIGAILEKAQNGERAPAAAGGAVETIDFMETYAEGLREMIRKGVGGGDRPLAGFHVAVDAGNGTGGFYATRVLEPLGCDVSGSQFLEPDGRFPNHVPNPENAEAMASACEAVKRSGADLGVIFDTDVDRAGCVDGSGREINRNRLVALASVIALQGNEGGTIVTDSITSAGLKEFLEGTLHAKHLRFKRGYRNVIDKAVELNEAGINAPLAIETSGHAALRENYFLDDGAYLATRILIEAARKKAAGEKLEDLIAALREPAEAKELRFSILPADFRPAGEKLLADLEAYGRKNGWSVADDSYEGVRISFGKGEGEGWFLLRLSVHDPVMPLNVESDVPGGCRVIARKLLAFLGERKELDTAPLRDYLK
ncbi:MAG: phosphomannomutase/phosphoglucomutase [Clostridia bacterium]|nr:phosphomannomutase/phosphoglucomutase [Clostridia bacterium]